MNAMDVIAVSGVIKYYIYDIALIIFAIHIIRRIREKRPLMNWERYIQRGWRIKSERVKKLIEMCYLLCILLFYAGSAHEYVIASILDLPQVITNSYYNEVGEVREVSKKYLTVEVKNGKFIIEELYRDEYKKYQVGDQVHVLYYEHIADGFVY